MRSLQPHLCTYFQLKQVANIHAISSRSLWDRLRITITPRLTLVNLYIYLHKACDWGFDHHKMFAKFREMGVTNRRFEDVFEPEIYDYVKS